jgi:hypothetical protein
MSKNSYLPVTEAEKLAWLKNFAGKLPLYATLLGLIATEVAAVAADALMLTFTIDQVEWFKRELAKRVSYKNLLMECEPGTPLGNYPEVGVGPAAPVAVDTVIFKRMSKLVQRIKNHPKYTAAIGEDLGIETHASVVSIVNAKPDLRVSIDTGNPVLKWTKRKFVATDLYVDRGDGKGFVFLTTATVPHFTDMSAKPAGFASAIWQYKAIYKINDEHTGIYSDVVSVVVSNHVA